VTHDQMEAMTMADRIVVMRDGRIEQIGAPLELYDRPVNEFVASFMGSPSINLLRATWNPDTSGGRFELEQGLQFATQQGFGKHERAAVTLGVRPEHLSLVGEQDGSPAQVKFIEPTGNETIITADLAGQEIQISLRERRALQTGEMVYVRPQDDKLHMFDGSSGIRLSA
jgi:multiple sugar transport system ATP-binding protein